MNVNFKKLRNVHSLSDKERCDYFVRKVADFELVWGLHDKAWAMAKAGVNEAIAFWPEQEFATVCAADEWEGFEPRSIPLSDFISEWLPGMEANRRMCLIFPTPSTHGMSLPPGTLSRLLKEELQQYF